MKPLDWFLVAAVLLTWYRVLGAIVFTDRATWILHEGRVLQAIGRRAMLATGFTALFLWRVWG